MGGGNNWWVFFGAPAPSPPSKPFCAGVEDTPFSGRTGGGLSPLFLFLQCLFGRTGIEPSPFKEELSHVYIYVSFQKFPKFKISSLLCIQKHLEVIGGLRFEISHNYEEWLTFSLKGRQKEWGGPSSTLSTEAGETERVGRTMRRERSSKTWPPRLWEAWVVDGKRWSRFPLHPLA